MSISKNEKLAKSAELLDDYLDTISDEDFLAMHESIKIDNGIVLADIAGEVQQTFDFKISGSETSHKALIISQESTREHTFSLYPCAATNTFSISGNDDTYADFGEVA